MSTSSTEFRVGIFAFLGIALLAFSILTLGKESFLFSSSYLLKAEFQQIQGVRKGSEVSLSGVKVGNVQSIDFYSDKGSLLLTLKIDQQYKSWIRAGATAELRTKGALGDKYIYLSSPKNSDVLLKDGDFLTVYEPKDLFQTIGDSAPKIDRFLDALQEVQILMKDINHGHQTREILKNASLASGQMVEVLSQTQKILLDIRGNISDNSKFKESMVHLTSILKKVDEGDGTLGALLNDPTIHQKLKTILGESPRNRYLKEVIRETIKNSDLSSNASTGL